MEMIMRRWLGLIFVAMMVAVSAYGQTFRGAINGTVADPSGALVASSTVKATNTATGVSLTAVTTSDGQFGFQDLPLGSYKVEVTAAGFRPAAVDSVPVTAGGAYTLTVKLTTGSAGTTVVEVSAAALTLDTTTATQDNIIPSEAVQDVPMNGRDFTQFPAVQPGYGGYSASGLGSLTCTTANQMNWHIDGVDNKDLWHNIPAVKQGGVLGIAWILLSLESIEALSSRSQSFPECCRKPGGTGILLVRISV